MDLDRNINPDGRGKYALIKLRNIPDQWPPDIQLAIETLENYAAVEWGRTGAEDEFFLIKLKDEYAQTALIAYANAAEKDDAEYGAAVFELANRAGKDSPFCHRPD